MSAGFTSVLLLLLLLCLLLEVRNSSAGPAGQRYVYPKGYQVGWKSPPKAFGYRVGCPLQNIQSLRKFKRPVQAVRPWKNPWGGLKRIQRRYPPNLHRPAPSPRWPWTQVAANLPQVLPPPPPPPQPRGFQVPVKGAKGSSKYSPSIVQVDGGFGSPIKQAHQVQVKYPTLPKPDYPQHQHQLYGSKMSPPKTHHGKGPTEQTQQAQYPIPNYPQHAHVYGGYYGVYTDPTRKDYGKGQPTQQHSSPTLPIPNYPQHPGVDVDYYGVHISPAKKHYGKGQPTQQQSSPTLPNPYHPGVDVGYYGVHVSPVIKHPGKGQVKQTQQVPVKHPPPTLPNPNHPGKVQTASHDATIVHVSMPSSHHVGHHVYNQVKQNPPTQYQTQVSLPGLGGKTKYAKLYVDVTDGGDGQNSGGKWTGKGIKDPPKLPTYNPEKPHHHHHLPDHVHYPPYGGAPPNVYDPNAHYHYHYPKQDVGIKYYGQKTYGHKYPVQHQVQFAVKM